MELTGQYYPLAVPKQCHDRTAHRRRRSDRADCKNPPFRPPNGANLTFKAAEHQLPPTGSPPVGAVGA